MSKSRGRRRLGSNTVADPRSSKPYHCKDQNTSSWLQQRRRILAYVVITVTFFSIEQPTNLGLTHGIRFSLRAPQEPK
jgi:hypothetical protein